MNGRKHSIEIIFPILLLSVFTLMALTLTVLEGRVYEENVSRALRNNDARISVAYVSEKIHQSDAEGCVSIGSLNDCPSLVIRQENSNLCYIFFDDGELRELNAGSELLPDSSMGNPICELKDFSIEMLNEKLLRISCTAKDGTRASTVIGLRA